MVIKSRLKYSII